jgi:hypothetical protein
MSDALLDALRELIQEDVGQRGLRGDPADNLITAYPQDFALACRSLAETKNAAVGIVTGFFIPHGNPPCGETDGPLGALFLARALVPLGISVVLATDAFCRPALEAGLWASGLRKQVPLVTLPSVEEAGSLSGQEYRQHFQDRTGALTHLIALERVGPSHTPDSLRAQSGDEEGPGARFREEVEECHHDRCHTMRGRDITANMSPAHRLFEAASHVTTIGIGDGGNEIGMGKIAWEVIRRNIPNGGLVACRVPTDHLIVCGISNWGAYGLAAGTRLLRGRRHDPDFFDLDREKEVLRIMVERGPLVDGMSGEPILAVDGLPFERYAEALKKIGDLVAAL